MNLLKLTWPDRTLVVDTNSASPQLPGVTYYGIEATHSQMCKFAGPSAPGFRTLSTDVRQWVLDAPGVIRLRWAVEDEEGKRRVRCEIQERISPLVSTQFLSPFGLHPSLCWEVDLRQKRTGHQ